MPCPKYFPTLLTDLLFSAFLLSAFLISSCKQTTTEKNDAYYKGLLSLADSLSHFNPARAESLYFAVVKDSASSTISYRVKALIGASEICSDRSAYDSAALLVDRASLLASQAGDSLLILQTLLAKGNLSIDLGDNEKAGTCFEQGLELAKRTGRAQDQNSFYLGLGLIEKEKGNFASAVKIYTEASKVSELSGNARNQALALENIGIVLNFTGDFKEALNYIRQAIEIRKKNNLLREYAMGLQNLGITYRKLDMFDSALNYYGQAREILQQLGDSNTLVRVQYNTGLVLKNQKKYSEALLAMNQALDLCRRKGIVDGEVYALHTLAAIADEQGETGRGIQYSDSAIALAKQRKLISNIPSFLERKQELLAKTGNFKEAYATAQSYIAISDSLLSLNKQKEIALLKTRFETERRESENVMLKKDLQFNQTRMIFLWGIMILSVVAFILVILMFRYRYKHLKEINLLSDEKVRLKEQELVLQSLIRTDLTNVNRSVREKLFPFNLRFQRKKDQEEFIQLLDEITREASRDPLSEFELMFRQLHPAFYEKLLARCPSLTKSEMQVCALLRLNLSSKDIARLLCLSLSTVETTRHHIRKKLDLESVDNLCSFLITI